MRVGFIGLGSMGLPMAENLRRAGHDVRRSGGDPGTGPRTDPSLDEHHQPRALPAAHGRTPQPAGFKLRHGLKDIRLVLGAADEVSTPLPLASLPRDHYLAAVVRGWADIDWAALAQLSAVNAGLTEAD